jgi:hypothetical protein
MLVRLENGTQEFVAQSYNEQVLLESFPQDKELIFVERVKRRSSYARNSCETPAENGRSDQGHP